MFAHFRGDGRKVRNLALFLPGDGLIAQLSVAVGAVFECDGVNDVRSGALICRVWPMWLGWPPGLRPVLAIRRDLVLSLNVRGTLLNLS